MLTVAEEATTMGTCEVVRVVPTPTITTLYSLIETLQDQVAAEDDTVVIAAVARLCNAGYVKFLNVSEDHEIAWTH